MTADRHAAHTLGAGERARLPEQCELHRMEAELLFDRIGVDSGWRALDLACGPLDILAERVGTAGSVVAMDRDPGPLELAGVRLVRGEPTATGLPGASFDLVHERLLLVTVARPEEVVAEMVRLARPGGYVALQDRDAISWACEPAHPAWDLLLAALIAAWPGDPHVGRRLPGLLRDAGLVDIDVDVHADLARAGEPDHTLLPRLVRSYRGQILAAGALTEADLDSAVHELEEHLDRPGTIVLCCTLFQAWGRKALLT